MSFKGRIHRLEASLEAKKKFFLWLEHAKAVGGWGSYWVQELKGPLVAFEWFADEEAYFLWHLVNHVNLTILENAQTNSDLHSFAHCALDGVLRQIARPAHSGVLVPVRPISELTQRATEYLYAKFTALFEEKLSLAAAIDDISETYLGGEGILFADSRATLDTEISNLRGTAETFSLLAVWIGVEPITAEMFTHGHPMVDAKATQLADLSRVQALIRSDNRGEFIAALHRACPSLAAS